MFESLSWDRIFGSWDVLLNCPIFDSEASEASGILGDLGPGILMSTEYLSQAHFRYPNDDYFLMGGAGFYT